MVPFFSEMMNAGGYNVTTQRWSIGAELDQMISKSAHVGWHRQTRAQTLIMDVTARWMMPRCAKTAVY